MLIYLRLHYFLCSCINLLLLHSVFWEITKLFVYLKQKGNSNQSHHK